jgi:multiple sugar transport system substrate-binding protein
MRLTRLLALFLLACLILPACGLATPPGGTLTLEAVTGTSTPAPSRTASPMPPPTLGVEAASLRGLSLQVWQAFAGPAAGLFTRQVAQFNAGNEWGILISPTGYGDYAGLFEAVNTALDSGQPPDLVAALPEQALAWDTNGAVVDLNPYLGDPQWGLQPDAMADIPSAFLTQDAIKGKQLGFPAQRSARILYYNRTWARELGFNNPPATAEDFRRQACAANANYHTDTDPTNDGYGGWIVKTDWQTTYSWLLALGGGVVHGSAYAFNTGQNLAALQFLKGLFDSHCAWLSTEPTPFDSFARRSALFISADLAGLPAETESMSRLKNPDEWTVIPFPGSQGNVLAAYGPSYTILKSTPAKQLAAWLFARWLLSPESQSQWVEATGLFPLRSSVLGMIQPYRQASPQWDAAVGYLSLAQGVPQLASWSKARYLLEDGLAVLFQNNLPVDKIPAVLEEMDSMAEEVRKK